MVSGPVCPTCGGPFGSCACVGGKVRALEPEVRHWLGLVELGVALILVGVITLLM